MGNDGWKRKPKKMDIKVFKQLIIRIKEHINDNSKFTKETTYSFWWELLLQKLSFEDADICREQIPNIQFGGQTNAIMLTRSILIFLKI